MKKSHLNMLNLPETVLFNDGHETRYTYAADGRKLRVEYRLNNFAIIDAPGEGIGIGGGIFNPRALNEVTEELVDDSGDIPAIEEPMFTTLMVRDYCGNYIYRNGALERVLTDNGYIEDGEMFFYVKDYQGNVHVVLNQSNQPVELNSYYPYGGLMGATTTEGTQPYKYSAKELDRENGIDWYDSNARWYDSMLGRTTTPDPLAEKYYSMSPYLWCAGNPVNYVDPTGMDIIADVLSQDNIRNSLTAQESDFVMFDSSGLLDNQLLSESTSTSENMIALKTLSKSAIVYSFHVLEKDHADKSFFDNLKNGDNYYRGVTEMPDAQTNPSPDDKVYIIVGNVLDKKQQVMTTAHEAYGHAFFYERFHDIEKASHTYRIEANMVWDEELQMNSFESVMIPTNQPLENHIKIVVNQAKKNYEERTKR